ncbi:CHASE2 domain-containing protein [Trinickia caryophylli]|uniref:histidine kinase n=2 Tax=Trinickia caryophylli TaxID=28094 RepID=A0A1X7D062_TRICW|nr:CHASE2 domain-containing protein [Trinickia caryophylli]TRX13630.1 CHASE2 domain-containing protein [Trinickia caryophylli]SMF05810.1 sensor domain CHASE2-containing protein [Trinickia caryophylli]
MTQDSSSRWPLSSGPPSRHKRMRPETRRYLLEWFAITCIGMAVVFACSLGNATAGLDRRIYDKLLQLHPRALAPEIAMVEIDDATIRQFGRWPWSRELQARLLAAAADAGAAAIVYDVLLTDPWRGEAPLSEALRKVPTFLPLTLRRVPNDVLPIAELPQQAFRDAAAGIGHIDFEADADGVVRGVALTESDGTRRWPYIDVPLFRAIREGAIALADGRYLSQGKPDPTNVREGEGGRVLIPFGASAHSRAHVSAAKLLDGQISAQTLSGKIVFVGVTAAGVHGRLMTPVSGDDGPASDVALHADVLSALLSDQLIHPVPRPWVATASLAFALVLLAGFFVLSPWRSLLLTVLLCVVVLAGSALLLGALDLWISPVPAMAALVLLYPLWSWRRLEMTMSRLRRELAILDSEPHLLPEPDITQYSFGGDVLERQIVLVERAAQRLQDMKRFVWDSLNSVPEPVIVADRVGIVLLVNKAARAHFARLDSPEPKGRPLSHVLGGFSLIKAIDTPAELEAEVRTGWPRVLDPTGRQVGVVKRGLEVRDHTGHDYLLRYARCRNERGEESGSWVAALVEVTALHAAERGREDALRLLSHDMRSRHASILALVELERSNNESERTRVLLERIERHAQRALNLADDFVQLARAESQAYALEPVSFGDIVIDASDEVWPQARAKDVRIEVRLDSEEYWVSADRSLMTRAMSNIINNAVKYSPNATIVVISVARRGTHYVQCSVSDEGYGIPKEMQAHLFEPFRRFHSPGQPTTNGAGLGMAFIKAVVTRHSGEVHVDSAPGEGTTVTIALPLLETTAAA